MTPRVDSISTTNDSDYPFFYSSSLPLLYYVAIGYLVLSSILAKRQSVRITLVLLLAVLVEATPSIMMTNPWVPDQYPFIAEPTLLSITHHITPFHVLDTSPGLALTFSPVLLVSDMPPLSLWQFSPFFGILATLLVILIGRDLELDGAMSGLLFLGFNFWYQTNIFHRQIYSFVLFLLFVLILLRLLDRRKATYSLAYVLVLGATIISHPGTPAFLMFSLVIVVVGFRLFNSNKALLFPTLLLIIIFLAYDVYINTGDFRRIVIFPINSMRQIVYGGLEQPAGFEYLVGYTESFRHLMNIRVLVATIYVGISSLTAIYMVFKGKNLKLRFIALLHLGLLLQFLIFVYGEKALRLRPLFFLIPTSALLWAGSPLWKAATAIRSKSFRSTTRNVAISCLVLLFLISPVLRYSGMPYLHPPTAELSGKLFLDRYYTYDSPIYGTEKNFAYGYSLIFEGQMPTGEPRTIAYPEQNVSLDRSYFLIYRYTTRDAYWVGNATYAGYLERLLELLPESHNHVYGNGRYHNIFLYRE